MRELLKTALVFSFLVVISGQARSQNALDDYVSEGLKNNELLKEKKGDFQKSLIALKEARSLFLPTTWFETDYTVADGGRSIDIPVGDLLNPVYSTLNQLTSSNSFPKVANVSESLVPNNYYDARIKTTMPLINPDLRFNRDIKQHQVTLQQNEIDIYKRELVKEIKVAYFNYLMATKAIDIYENAMAVTKENVRVNEALLKEGKGLYAYVSRAQSEVSTVEAQLQTAQNEQKNAKAYFNFLLNKPLQDEIVTSDYEMSVSLLAPLASADSADVNRREELKSLSIAGDIDRNILKMNQSFRTPRLNFFLDLGSQGYDFAVNNKSFFYLGGLQLQIPIFTGKRNLYEIESAQIDLDNLKLKTDNTQNQLQLAAFVSRNNALNAYNNYLAAVKQQEASQNYFTLINRGYKEGTNNFLEMLDARSQLTNSALQVNISIYKFFSALADYERQTASYSFNQ